VALPFFTSHPHRLQRRLSVVLSMVICMWMLAAATHFHAPLDDVDAHHSAKELCGFCASLPAGGAAPTVWTFVPTDHRQHVLAPAEILLAVPVVAVASYRSRAPPLV
jgi:hypothetical protein